MTHDPIDRRFVRLPEGLVHMRSVPATQAGAPLVLLHASPGSSRGLVPLLAALAAAGSPELIAPDTLGHGDSAPAAAASPEIGDYADATVRLLDALRIDRATIYGAHTGARIACEIGVRHPDRVIRVIVDGIADYAPAMRDELLARYAPAVLPDDYGIQLMWAFHFVRDQALHFPHYARDPEHRLMSRAVPPAQALHDSTLEVLKALGTYHHAYHAAFRYPTRARLAALTRPLALLDAVNEVPALRAQTQAIVAAAADAEIVPVGAGIAEKAAAIRALLVR